MKELSDEVNSMLNSMGQLSRKIALINLYDKNYNIENYITDLINGSEEGTLRRNGFMKTLNPHKDVIVYELNGVGKFVFKETKDKKYELIQTQFIRQST